MAWGTSAGEHFLASNPPSGENAGLALGGKLYDQGGAVVNIRAAKYRAIGTWNPDAGTGDARAAILQALTDLGLGGVLYYPPGTYPLSAAVATTNMVIMQGCGLAPSIIQSSSTTNDGFQLTGDYCVIEDLNFNNTAIATSVSGAAVVFTSTNYPIISRCRMIWFNGVTNVSGRGWIVRDCYMAPANYGIYQKNPGNPDAGDCSAYGNTIDLGTYAGSGIRIESGGGLKITGSKFLNGQYGIDLMVADGATTSVLVITGNSLEVQTKANIRLNRLGTTGVWSMIVITGNQLTLFNATAAVDGVQVGSAGISNVTITGNAMRGHQTWSTAVHCLTGADFVTVEGNTFFNHLVAVKVDVNCGLYLGPNHYRSVTTAWSSAQTANTSPDPLHVHEHRCDLGNITSTTVYSNFFRIDIPTFTGGTLEVVIAGIVQGKGSFSNRYHKTLIRDAGNITATDITGPTLAGQVIDAQFDVATTAGAIYIGFRVNAAGLGTAINGQVQIKATGFISQLQQLTSI